jgi:hypothetical protein
MRLFEAIIELNHRAVANGKPVATWAGGLKQVPIEPKGLAKGRIWLIFEENRLKLVKMRLAMATNVKPKAALGLAKAFQGLRYLTFEFSFVAFVMTKAFMGLTKVTFGLAKAFQGLRYITFGLSFVAFWLAKAFVMKAKPFIGLTKASKGSSNTPPVGDKPSPTECRLLPRQPTGYKL